MEQAFENLEQRLQQAGHSLRYPPTPQIAGTRVTVQPRWRPAFTLALAALLMAAAALLAVPDVRARLAEFLQVGGVRIAIPTEYALAPAHTEPSPGYYGEVVPLIAFTGDTTLDVARATANFDIPLPTYPESLGEPDKVYIQRMNVNGSHYMVILAWLDEDQDVEMALYILGEGIQLTKGPPEVIELVEVNGQPAALVHGNHYLRMGNRERYGVLVKAPALIWDGGNVTYRLEANYAVDEMVRIAESIPTEE